MQNGDLERQMPLLCVSSPLSFPLAFMAELSWYGPAIGHFRSPVLAVSPPNFLFPSSLLAGCLRSRNILDSVSTAQQQLKVESIISPF